MEASIEVLRFNSKSSLWRAGGGCLQMSGAWIGRHPSLNIRCRKINTLPAEWEEFERERNQDDPPIVRSFRNKETGDMVGFDPRMTPECLKQKGVKLEVFRLV